MGKVQSKLPEFIDQVKPVSTQLSGFILSFPFYSQALLV